MRAFVITAAGRGEVWDVDPPRPGRDEVVVEVDRAGVCGTDAEFFSGAMSYLHNGQAAYPLRIGHEWSGVVAEIGAEVDPVWLGRRVTGDTMLGCRHCDRCAAGRQHLCADRYEIGIRNGWPGALAECLPVPVAALHPLPDPVDAAMGALVEPGGVALRAVLAADLAAGERLLVFGPGTIGLLAAQIAAARGVEVHLTGPYQPTLTFARSLGFAHVWSPGSVPDLRFDAIVDASNGVDVPARAVGLVEPGRRVVLVGLSGEPSLVDSRTVALKDLTVVGILSASGGLAGAIELYASGAVDPRPLVAATVGLADAAAALGGDRPAAWGAAPKIHIDPRL